MDRGGGPGAEGDNPVEARGLEEAGEPEHRRWPRLRRKRLHRRRGGGGRGSVSRSDLLANMIFISSARRQLSDSSIPSHLSQKTDSNNTFSYRRKRISVCTLKAGRGICSFLPGPGLDSMLGNKRPKWPTTRNAKRPRSPTATKHSESPTPSRPPHIPPAAAATPVENTKVKAIAMALNRGLRSGIRLLAAGAEASKPGKRPSRPASHGLDLPPLTDLGLLRSDSLRLGAVFLLVVVVGMHEAVDPLVTWRIVPVA